MSMWAGIGKTVAAVAVVGAGLAIFGIYMQSWAGMSKEPLTSLISGEKKVLQEIQGACFPMFGIGRNESTCKLWLRQYRALERYAYSDSDLFAADVEKQAEEAYKHLYEAKSASSTAPIVASPSIKSENPKQGKENGEGLE